MQRQSLGSPGRERLSPNDAVLNSVDHNRRESTPASFCSDEIKPEKSPRFQTQPEQLIHLIPLLIVFCFVVLYLSSHDPSPQDLAQFHGINNKHPADIIEMNEIDDIGNVDNNKEMKRSGAFAIRSQRNLKEEIIERDTSKSQSHRKLADF